MLTKEEVRRHLKNTLQETRFPMKRREGKVRDIYDLGDKVLFVATDRLSAFDRSVAFIPFKGHILNMTSSFWFERTKDIVPNHVLDIPDPNVCVGKKMTIFPVEFVVRGYLSGSTDTSAWTAYANGERLFCGVRLPEGMVKNQPFEAPIITPTTKSAIHDEKISPMEIVDRGFMTKFQWDKVSDIVLKLFKRGEEIARENGLILVDTKYELGYDENHTIYLCDEIHTPDSSRFWIAESYEKNFNEGKEPENVDKEFLRLWFKEHANPYEDAELPQAPEDLVIELSQRYQKLYEMITGQKFIYDEVIDTATRIERNLRQRGYLS